MPKCGADIDREIINRPIRTSRLRHREFYGMEVPHPQSPKMKKLYYWIDFLGLTKVEVMEVARYLLRRDVASFKDLDESQISRILDALEGHHLVATQYAQRPPGAWTGGR